MGVPRGQLNTSSKTHPAILQQATKRCTLENWESSDDRKYSERETGLVKVCDGILIGELKKL